MKNNYWTRKKVVLLLLLVVGFLWNVLFVLPGISPKISRAINSNAITDMLEDIYWDGIPLLISIPVALTSIVYSVRRLYSEYKSEQLFIKKVWGDFIYVAFSLVTLIMHCITLSYIVNCMIAG